MTFYSYYQQPKASTSEQYGLDNLQGEHKGLKWTKDMQYSLYHILPVSGVDMPASLSCKFTKVPLLIDAIDRWLEENVAQLTFPKTKKHV